MIYVPSNQIGDLLKIDSLQTALHKGFGQTCSIPSSAIFTPPRLHLNAPLGVTLIKPSMITSTTTATTTTATTTTLGLKIVSVRTDNSPYNVSNVPSSIFMIDSTTGAVSHVLPGDLITARRTAGAAGVATSVMHAKHDNAPLTCLIYGAGIQGEEHARVMIAVRPEITKVVIVNRSRPRLDKLTTLLKQEAQYSKVEFVGLLESEEDLIDGFLSSADVVCCCVSRISGEER